MKKSLMFAALLLAVASLFAQTRTFQWENRQRQFLLYEPADRTAPVPVMFFLHGLGDNITNCAASMNFSQLASQWGWCIVVPQALSVQGSTMWNVGFGGTADDAGFFLALLDSLQGVGMVNPDSVFFTGFSLGGFMTHKMAIEHGDRLNACAPVSGLITYDLADEVPPAPVRLLHIHGTSDNVVGWNGSSSYFGNIGIGVDSIVSYWTGWNGCTSEPEIDSFPDTRSDGLRFVRYTYTGGDAEFQLIKVIGGSHDWYSGSNRDIDYFDVIHKFFLGDASTMGLNAPQDPSPRFEVWPNPTDGLLNIYSAEPVELDLVDNRGTVVGNYAVVPGRSEIDLCSYSSGVYFLSDKHGKTVKVALR
jgi:polyhydroxybutyrate depolymerase